MAGTIGDLCYPGERPNLSSGLTLSTHQAPSLGKWLPCGYPFIVLAHMPASEMLKMQPGRVEHSIPICGLLLGNNETLVNQGCSQSPALGFAVVCLVFLVYTLILWLVIGGKFFNTARTLVFC